MNTLISKEKIIEVLRTDIVCLDSKYEHLVMKHHELEKNHKHLKQKQAQENVVDPDNLTRETWHVTNKTCKQAERVSTAPKTALSNKFSVLDCQQYHNKMNWITTKLPKVKT